jgi:protein-S-isoprenylcysteine O-methyltransferase Ste14
MTSEQLIVILGAVLALLFAYVPGFATWFEPLDPTKKRLLMLGMLVVITGAVFGLSCAKIFTAITCDQKGAVALVTALIYAVIANQGTYSILPKAGLNK